MRPADGVDLYWIPLGAGEVLPITRVSGRIFEFVSAQRQGRAPAPLFHAAILVFVDGVRFAIEMGPAWGNRMADRGVVLTGPVGLRLLERSRLFRYEVRRWREGTIPDLHFAVGGAVRVAAGGDMASRVLDLVAEAPNATWGRDEQRTGDMWNSNSLAAWLLERSGVDAAAVTPPRPGRAPGWRAGIVVARRPSAVA